MGNLSSINFKKTKANNAFQLKHNTIMRPKYVIDSIDKVESNIDILTALQNQFNIIQDAKKTYEKTYNQKFQSTNYLHSAVVNIKPDTTMDDLEKLAKHLHDKYGFQCYQISIHRDEGHINDNGEKVINHHAHMEFVTLDRDTGKSCFRLNKADLRNIQDETARILGMERGKAGNKRIEPRKYGALKEKEKKEIQAMKIENEKKLKSKDKQWLRKFVYSTFEDTRKSMIEENKNARLLCSDDDEESMILYDKDDYKALRDEKAYIEMLIENCENPEDIEKQTDIMLLAMKKIEEVREKARARAKDKGRIQKQDMEYYKNLANVPAPIGEITLNNEPKIENNDDEMKEQIKTLEKQNKDLKANNDTLTLENQTMKSELSYIKQFLEINNLVDRIKHFFNNIGKKLSMEFEEPNQAPNHAQPSQEIQLTPIKSAWEIKRDEKNKGRGGR